MNPYIISLHGLPRSGTNYLQFLLEQNFAIERLKIAGKHCPYQPKSYGKMIFISKHPIAWAYSIWNFRHGKKLWSEFIGQPYVSEYSIAHMMFATPFHYWMAFNHHWLKFTGAVHVRHEELEGENAVSFLEWLQKEWRLVKKVEEWVWTSDRMGKNGSPMIGHKYITRPWRKICTEAEERLIMASIDFKLLEALGYGEKRVPTISS